MSDSDIACSGVDGVPPSREHAVEPLRRESLTANPLDLFDSWFKAACISPFDGAVVLSTVSANGSPSSRVVLLKAYDHSGFTIFTNYTSRKADQLEVNPRCSLLFWWQSDVRQVRVEGCAERVTAKASDAYFATRPRGSQIGAWASPQSTVIEDRESLKVRVAACAERFKDGPVPRPEHWGGYRLVPSYIEFWQAGKDRLHDRFAYTRSAGDTWHVERLAP